MNWEEFYNHFREPEFIPGYEIQNRLGGGAFGEVYKARKHSIGKAYAIKFLKVDNTAQQEAVRRELEQVRLFAAIDHPNLVTIEDLGVVLGVPYLVMGYAGEETLARRLHRGGLERREALSCFTQACRGVLALHDRRLVHFDLKPGNIFLHGEVARVGDYGLSKLLTDGRLTLSFGRGTPHYMAPEMLRGRADHRADIYSLGVILYESIAGKVPYEAASSSGLVIREEDTPPEFPADFPTDLRTVVEKTLRLDPVDRYETVAELLEALGQSARRGDSIRFEHIPPADVPASIAALRPTPPPAPEPVVDVASVDGAESGDPPAPGARVELSRSAGELRATAAEFARGAVEVARGVWDGLRTGREEPPLPPPPRTVTIPVPPRASGGILGALRAAVVLFVEVFIALLRGALRWIARGFRLARGRVDTGSSSGVWKVVRLSVLLLFLALLGGVVMVVVLTVLGDPLGL